MKNDGSLSWIVISRGMNKSVEDIFEEREESSHHEELQLVPAPGNRDNQSPQSYPVSKMFVPIDQRKWNEIPSVNNAIKGPCLGESRRS